MRIAIIVLFAFSSTLTALSLWHSSTKDSIICSANMDMYNYNLMIPAVIQFRMNGGNGELFYDGPVYSSTAHIEGFLSRQVSFSSKKDGVNMILTSTHVQKFAKDAPPTTDAQKLLPDFFVVENASMNVRIERFHEGYLFYKDNLPLMLCS